ncbi:MAG: T9SS type A sorting domain-containing protein, partial [Chitinophagales bacterium]
VQIFVYPNPVMTDINITIDNQYKPGFLVELYSLDGSLLNQSIQFENLFTLNTGHLAASTYLLKITTEDGIIFGDKIVVQ